MTPTQQTQRPISFEAGIRETFGDPSWFGIKGALAPEVMEKVGKAILTVAGADGTISEREWNRFVALALRAGMPPQAIEVLGRFDGANASLADYFDDETRLMAKLILFEAIKVARADGYGDKERAAARSAAEMLDISADVVVALENLVEIEETVANARMQLLRPVLTR